MGKITFVLGGARSGKSRYAVKLAGKEKGARVAFISTCLPLDAEMKKRIELHKKARPAHWQTFEKPQDMPSFLKKIGSKFDVILIDCMTLLVSDRLLKGLAEKAIEREIKEMLSQLKKAKAGSIIVSNEVGLGIVPENKLARDFRDIAGRVNQFTAAEAGRVFFMVSAIPWRIK